MMKQAAFSFGHPDSLMPLRGKKKEKKRKTHTQRERFKNYEKSCKGKIGHASKKYRIEECHKIWEMYATDINVIPKSQQSMLYERKT